MNIRVAVVEPQYVFASALLSAISDDGDIDVAQVVLSARDLDLTVPCEVVVLDVDPNLDDVANSIKVCRAIAGHPRICILRTQPTELFVPEEHLSDTTVVLKSCAPDELRQAIRAAADDQLVANGAEDKLLLRPERRSAAR